MSNPTHNAEGDFDTSLDHMELAADAARLRAQAKSYREIAAIQGVNVATAHNRVKRALAAVPVEAVADLRRVELERMDLLVAKAFDILEASHPYVSQGKVFYDLEDDGPKLQAIRELRQLSESRRKLLGLDAPIQHNLTVDDGFMARIEQFEKDLGLQAPKELGELVQVASDVTVQDVTEPRT